MRTMSLLQLQGYIEPLLFIERCLSCDCRGYIEPLLRNASHFPSFCFRKIQISKNISLQASLHDIFIGFVLCSIGLSILNYSLKEFFRVALLFICQGAIIMSLTDCARQRRRRDLNPRAAINDLHPFQGCLFNHLSTSAK